MIFTTALPRVVLGGTLALMLSACDQSAPDNTSRADRGTTVAAMELTERDLSRRLMVSAPVEPRMHIRLASRTSGTVDAVHKEEGDHVETGEYQRARADLQIAESERELWQARVNFGRIEAPRESVVTARLIEPGEAVNAQDTLFELAALDQLVVQPGPSELDAVHLEKGQTLPVRLDALPDMTLEGTVSRIFPAASRDSRLVTVEVALPEDASQRAGNPGQPAAVPR